MIGAKEPDRPICLDQPANGNIPLTFAEKVMREGNEIDLRRDYELTARRAKIALTYYCRTICGWIAGCQSDSCEKRANDG
jgi:hypothetical protein